MMKLGWTCAGNVRNHHKYRQLLPLGVIGKLYSHALIVGNAFLRLEHFLLEGAKIQHWCVLIGLSAAGNDTMDLSRVVGLLQHVDQLALSDTIESRHRQTTLRTRPVPLSR